MQVWLHSVLLLTLAAEVDAAPAKDAEVKTAEPSDVDGRIGAAEEAWNSANWIRVRELLEPIADNEELTDPLQRQRVLLTLADATIQDSTLPDADRRTRAGDHLLRLMKADPEWKLKKSVYSPELYDLYLDKREERLAQTGSRCRAELNACHADKDSLESRLEETQKQYDELREKYETQDVAVGVKRSRALALFPLGISHFLNAGRLRGKEAPPRVKLDRALGAMFLTLEATFGIAGIALLAYRSTVDGCRRTRAFQPGSLVCDPRTGSEADLAAQEDAVVRRRKAEEGMAWAFLGTVAIDIVLAQIRFEDFRIEYTAPRNEVEAEERKANDDTRRRPAKPRAKVRPTATHIHRGAGFGLDIRF
jgi:hypothetical protein